MYFINTQTFWHFCFYSLFSSQYKKEVESSDQNTSIGWDLKYLQYNN